MNLVFHISEDGSEIELKHCASSKTRVKSSRKYFVHLNWMRLATNPSWLDSSIGRAAVWKPKDASSHFARDNEFFVVLCSVRYNEMSLPTSSWATIGNICWNCILCMGKKKNRGKKTGHLCAVYTKVIPLFLINDQ